MMKKYLMTGVAALAISAALTSCGHDSAGFSSIEEAKTAQYADAFKKTFGKIDSKQDWGFGSTVVAARTRTYVDVNGNMWAEKPNVTVEEKNKVKDFVNMTLDEMKAQKHDYQTTFPENLTNYWVSQVWTGTDTYTDGDGGSVGVGSSKMNNLKIADSAAGTINENGELSETGWYHVNNFNRGDNTDWSGNTFVGNSGTLDFAYHNSYDSRYHNRWITVKGEDISSELAGYYYVCFDFEGTLTNTVTRCQLDFQWTHKLENGNTQTDNKSIMAEFNGNLDEAGIKAALADMDNKYTSDGVEYDVTNATVRDIQVVSANNIVAPNNVYTDWIIRLVAATPETPDNVTAQGRVFCEDLGDIGDFDFNDVVFDAYIYQSGKIEIDVLAAGGTLPISVAGQTITMGKMKNTGEGTAANQHISITAETAAANGWTSIVSIPVVVSQTNPAAEIELRADVGSAPHKFCAPIGTKWVDEYVSIKKAYPDFEKWVGDRNNYKNWSNNPVAKYVDLDLSNNEE